MAACAACLDRKLNHRALDVGFVPIVQSITALRKQIANNDRERPAVLASRWSGGGDLLPMCLRLHTLIERKVCPNPDGPLAIVACLNDRNIESAIFCVDLLGRGNFAIFPHGA